SARILHGFFEDFLEGGCEMNWKQRSISIVAMTAVFVLMAGCKSNTQQATNATGDSAQTATGPAASPAGTAVAPAGAPAAASSPTRPAASGSWAAPMPQTRAAAAPAAPAAQTAPAAPAAPPPPSAVDLPVGTELRVRLDDDLGSKISQSGQA